MTLAYSLSGLVPWATPSQAGPGAVTGMTVTLTVTGRSRAQSRSRRSLAVHRHWQCPVNSGWTTGRHCHWHDRDSDRHRQSRCPGTIAGSHGHGPGAGPLRPGHSDWLGHRHLHCFAHSFGPRVAVQLRFSLARPKNPGRGSPTQSRRHGAGYRAGSTAKY